MCVCGNNITSISLYDLDTCLNSESQLLGPSVLHSTTNLLESPKTIFNMFDTNKLNHSCEHEPCNPSARDILYTGTSMLEDPSARDTLYPSTSMLKVRKGYISEKKSEKRNLILVRNFHGHFSFQTRKRATVHVSEKLKKV